MARQRGLHLLASHIPPALQIEGDCLVLITSIQKSSHLSWDLMPMWRATKELLTTFPHWTIHYYKRSANRVADLLAANEILVHSDQVAELPPHIRQRTNTEREHASFYTRSFYFPPPLAREGDAGLRGEYLSTQLLHPYPN